MQPTRQDLGSLAARILKDAAPEEAVVLAWPLVCGSAVAARTEAFSFVDGILWIRVPDSGWKAQLEAFSALYRQKLSELSGIKVNRIGYEVTSRSPSEQRP
jgi:hypothetical protein